MNRKEPPKLGERSEPVRSEAWLTTWLCEFYFAIRHIQTCDIDKRFLSVCLSVSVCYVLMLSKRNHIETDNWSRTNVNNTKNWIYNERNQSSPNQIRENTRTSRYTDLLDHLSGPPTPHRLCIYRSKCITRSLFSVSAVPSLSFTRLPVPPWNRGREGRIGS